MPVHYYNTPAPNRFMSDPMYQSNRQPPQRVDLENAILQGGAQQASAAPNRLAALMDYIKNLDPGSVVREGEFDTSTLLQALDPSSVVIEGEYPFDPTLAVGAREGEYSWSEMMRDKYNAAVDRNSAVIEGEVNYLTYKFPDKQSKSEAITTLMQFYKEGNPETYFGMSDGQIKKLLDMVAGQIQAPPAVQEGIDRMSE